MPHPDKKGVTDIYADGELILSVSDDAVIEAGLKVGATLDEQAILEIEHAVTLTKACHKAYDYLSYGDLSSKKLYDKLMRYGFSEDISLDACERMKSLGYIDDERYAAALAKSMAETKLYGPRRIEQELKIRGISDNDIDTAIFSLDINFEESILSLINGKFKNKTDRNKLIQALMRYGHEWDCISGVLHDLTEDFYE